MYAEFQMRIMTFLEHFKLSNMCISTTMLYIDMLMV